MQLTFNRTFVKPFIFLCSNDISALNTARSRVLPYTDYVFTTWEIGTGLMEGPSQRVPKDVSNLTDPAFADQTGPFYAIKENNDILFGSDPLGLQPLYFCFASGVLVVSNRSQLLFTALSLAPELSDTALSGWLAGQPVPDLSIYSNITVLPAGNALLYSKNQIRLYPYWDIDPKNTLHFNDSHAYGDYFRLLAAQCRG